MKANMGSLDKIARISFAILIGVLIYTNIISGTLAIVALILSGILVLTSLMSICPIYIIFGFNTCTRKEQTFKKSIK